MSTSVRKRDGNVVPLDPSKISHAIAAAWREVRADEPDPDIAEGVLAVLSDGVVDVERIQDTVERMLMAAGEFDVAKAYILYREERTRDRARSKPDPRAIGDYIHASKYARYLPELARREVYDETVARVELMHLKRFAHLPRSVRSDITAAFDLVRDKRVLPSMRSMQFGGVAIEVNNARGYNCSATLVDRPRVFAEAMFLLLSGCGVGYSVQIDHVVKLPPIARVNTRDVVHHVVGDDIEGWADAVDALVMGHITGRYVEFAYHLIRDAGSVLKTSGGRAPGHLKLKVALDRIRTVLDGAQGRRLRPIECHRIMCHIADAVLSGGIRRSAMIALFSVEDEEMTHCKANAEWFVHEPWLANANNSAVLLRGDVREDQFRGLFEATRMFGEPGILFVDDYRHATNPCAEIALDPTYVNPDGSRSTGWAMCNLTEINASLLTSRQDFLDVAYAATVIGTCQATYTDMPYLGAVTEAILRRDALLGIGMTGMQDSPAIACDPDLQREVATACVEWNRALAIVLGINPAARVTCVKPSGTTTLELGICGSGIHPAHALRYIRRVTADELEIVFQAFKATNPHMCVRKPDGKWVVEFAVEAPAGAKFRTDYTAIEFCEMVRSTQANWVLPGTAREGTVPGLRHNVSNTITVRDHEWTDVADWIWAHRDGLTGISLLSDYGDTLYAFAPFEAVTTPAQQRRWDEIIAGYRPVDYLGMFEGEDGTALVGEAACAGGACNV